MSNNEEEISSFKRRLSLLEHFFDTIRVLGGWKGICIIAVTLLVFYLFVLYTVSKRHKTIAELKRRRKEK